MLRTTIFTVFTILAAAIFVKSALVNPSVARQLKIYKDRVNMLSLILERECPDTVIANPQLNKREVIDQSSDDETASALLDLEKNLLNELVKCRAGKKENRTPATKPPKTQLPVCSHATGYIKMSLDLVNYLNPSKNKANGATCNAKGGSSCDIYFEICVSPLRERNCSVYHTITEVVGSDWSMSFTSDVGGIANPLILDMGEQTSWKGLNIQVTVREKNINQIPDDVVDEFSYDAVDSPGSPSSNVNLPSSIDKQPKSLLAIGTRTYCASPVTTKTTLTATTTTPTASTATFTTPTTTLRNITATLALQACASAVNLTESWRRDSAGSDLRPVDGDYNCDTRKMVELGRPWFRFSGAAGNRLLDKCPPQYSCGTFIGLWSSDPMPNDVGLETLIDVSWSQDPGFSFACKPYSSYRQVSVMRCSTRQYDFIYRYDGSAIGCYAGFCGMN